MTTSKGPKRAVRRALVPAALLAVLALSACGANDSEGDKANPASASNGKAVPEADRDLNAATQRDGALSNAFDVESSGDNLSVQGDSPGSKALQTRAVVSTGTVSMRGDDVARVRFHVLSVIDEYRGQIADENTTTDEDGAVTTSRIVVRVPSAEFDAAMTDLAEIGDPISSSRKSEDVTTEVIDNEARIRAQTKSLERMEALLAQAQSLKDIVAIESQLTRRQADLDSLKSQQAYLQDQTSLSTIAVHMEKTKEKADKKDDNTGFIPGLKSGWDGLSTFATGAATVLGVLLPFSVVILILGAPLWLALSAVRRRRPPVENPGAPA